MVSQNDVMLLNQYYARANSLASQKNQMKLLLEDLKNALEEVKNSESEEIYKNLGVVLIKVTKDKMIKDLENEIDLLDVRIKSVEKQEEIVLKELDKLRGKIELEVKKEQSQEKDKK